VGIEADRVVKKVTIDVFREIVQRTPVDTGLARCNWLLGISYRPGDTTDTAVKSGQPAINGAMMQLGSVAAGGVNYIVNNIGYVAFLEQGSSQQSPSGMVRLTADRWQGMVDEAVRSKR